MTDHTDTETETEMHDTPASDAAPAEEPDPNDPSTWDGERPPEGAVASREDFEVQRGSDGDVLPVWERVPGTQKWVQVVPARQGDANRYLPESGDPNDLTDKKIAEILNTFFVEPEWNLDTSTPEEAIGDIKAFGVEPLVMAWYNASGFEYQMGMVSDNADLLQAVEGNTKTGN